MTTTTTTTAAGDLHLNQLVCFKSPVAIEVAAKNQRKGHCNFNNLRWGTCHAESIIPVVKKTITNCQGVNIILTSSDETSGPCVLLTPNGLIQNPLSWLHWLKNGIPQQSRAVSTTSCFLAHDCNGNHRPGFDSISISISVLLLNIILLLCLRQICDPCFLITITIVCWLGIPATWGLGSLDSSTTDCLASCQPLAGTTALGACFCHCILDSHHDPKTLLKGLDLSGLKVAWGSMGNTWKYRRGLRCCKHPFYAFDLNISEKQLSKLFGVSWCFQCTWNATT